LGRSEREKEKEEMKPTFIALLAFHLCLGGCGKKEPVQPVQPSASNPEAKKPGTVLWEFETGDGVFSSPAIGSDGTVYVGEGGLAGKKLYAINSKSGVKLWEFEMGDWVFSSPAIGSDGTVYVGSWDKKLYAIKTESKGLAKSPWPMRGQNARHTGRVPK
jgi:outer membrane protein assembly factor BamB